MQDSSKFYTYWFALSAIYISEKQKPRLSLIFQTGFFLQFELLSGNMS